MEKPVEVVVVGNVGIDTNVYVGAGGIDLGTESHFTENLDTIGQAGGYASRGYARLGRQTAFIGHVGDDYHGHHIREELARDGIDTRGLFVDPAGTSRSINLVTADGRRRNFYDGKGHMHIQPDPATCRAVLAGARLAHFNIPNWARTLLPVARELGVTIACDLQDVASPDDPYRRDFVRYADILFFSAVNRDDAGPLISAYLALRPDAVVIAGMGARGCMMGTHAGIGCYPPAQMDEPVVDTNGAGDSLAVGFLTSYILEGCSLEESIRRGQIAARYKCSQRATSARLITPELMERYFAAGGGRDAS